MAQPIQALIATKTVNNTRDSKTVLPSALNSISANNYATTLLGIVPNYNSVPAMVAAYHNVATTTVVKCRAATFVLYRGSTKASIVAAPIPLVLERMDQLKKDFFKALRAILAQAATSKTIVTLVTLLIAAPDLGTSTSTPTQLTTAANKPPLLLTLSEIVWQAVGIDQFLD